MAYFWVNHKQTVKQERGNDGKGSKNGFLWSPKNKKNGTKNQFYDNMKEVKKGDIIFSYANTCIENVGIATSEAYDSNKPIGFDYNDQTWGKDGWKVDVDFSYRVKKTFNPKENIKLIENMMPTKYSPLNKNFSGNQGCYLARISDDLGRKIIELTSSDMKFYLMTKILIINGGQTFAHSGGKFNATVSNWTKSFFESKPNNEVKTVNINEDFKPDDEVAKFVWADIIIYHTPVWWFSIPNRLKLYIDEVFTAGHDNGMYVSDGRSRKSDNPKLHYGTGGSLQGRKYMFTSSWNAPTEAFTVKGEFFDQHSVDEVLVGFHKMNQFIGLSKVNGFHFHEMEKGVTDEYIANYHKEYLQHLETVFG